MKEKILWLIACVTVGFIVLFAADPIGNLEPPQTLLIWFAISGALFYYIYTTKLNVTDSRYYGQAEEEINAGTIDQGLWSKSLVKAKGNEDVRKAEYIKLRAKQLQKES